MNLCRRHHISETAEDGIETEIIRQHSKHVVHCYACRDGHKIIILELPEHYTIAVVAYEHTVRITVSHRLHTFIRRVERHRFPIRVLFPSNSRMTHILAINSYALRFRHIKIVHVRLLHNKQFLNLHNRICKQYSHLLSIIEVQTYREYTVYLLVLQGFYQCVGIRIRCCLETHVGISHHIGTYSNEILEKPVNLTCVLVSSTERKIPFTISHTYCSMMPDPFHFPSRQAAETARVYHILLIEQTVIIHIIVEYLFHGIVEVSLQILTVLVNHEIEIRCTYNGYRDAVVEVMVNSRYAHHGIKLTIKHIFGKVPFLTVNLNKLGFNAVFLRPSLIDRLLNTAGINTDFLAVESSDILRIYRRIGIVYKDIVFLTAHRLG